MKKSFIIHHDYQKHFELLSDEELGIFMRALMKYEITGEEPDFKDNGLLRMAFSFIKSDLDRNREKWEDKADISRENGKRGGRPKKNLEEEENQNGKEETQKTQQVFEEPKKAVNVNANVNVNVNANVLKEEAGEEEKPAAAPSWISEYENNVGLVPPMVLEEINSYEMADEVVIEAIKEAVKSDARRPKYICAILQDFKEHNIKTKADVEARRVEREKKKQSAQYHNKDKPTNAYHNPAQTEFENLERFYAN